MGKSKSKDPTYPGMPPIARLNREWLFTEKIDGTNGLISIEQHSFGTAAADEVIAMHVETGTTCVVLDSGEADEEGMPLHEYWVRAGSKNRWLIGENGDNYGFGAWVRDNAHSLAEVLGEGLHRGEWWGSGIQRGYRLPKGEKRFSLFNVTRWVMEDTAIDGKFYLASATKIPFDAVPGLDVVPYLGSTISDLSGEVDDWIYDLGAHGSRAVPGFMKPEGIVAFQPSSLVTFKVTIENDSVPKSAVRNA